MVGISFNHAEEYLHGNCHHGIRPRTEVVNELVQSGEECSVVSSWSPSQEIPETCLAPWERKPAVSGQMKTPSLLRTGCSLPSIPTCFQEEARLSRGSYSYQLWFTRPHMLTSPAHILLREKRDTPSRRNWPEVSQDSHPTGPMEQRESSSKTCLLLLSSACTPRQTHWGFVRQGAGTGQCFLNFNVYVSSLRILLKCKSWFSGCYGLKSVPSKLLCWSPSCYYLRTWLHLEIGSLKGSLG